MRIAGLGKNTGSIFGVLKGQRVQNRKYKLVLSCPSGLARNMLLDLLRRWDVLCIISPPRRRCSLAQRFARETLRKQEKRSGPTWGAYCPDGERLLPPYGKGRLLEEEELQALITLLQLRHRQLTR